MRSHLEDLAAAFRELGETEEQALESAIGQFGNSRTLRRDWRRAIDRSSTGSLRRSVRISLWAHTANAAIFYLSLRFWPNWMYTEHFLYLMVFPIPAGVLAGCLARSREMKGSLIAQSLLYVPWVTFLFCLLIFPKAVEILGDYGQEPTVFNVAAEVTHGRFMLGWGTLVILGTGLGWIASGTVAAGVGGWLRRMLARPAAHVATN